MLPNNNRTSEICMSLMKNLGHNSQELDKELAYVAIQEEHGFNELVLQRLPLPPYSYESFLKMSDEDKKQFLFKNADYFREGEGGVYSNARSKVINENYSNIQWLTKIMNIFEICGDIENMTKVENRLEMFKY